MTNTNFFGHEGYEAQFSAWDGKMNTACWGAEIAPRFGGVFTVKLAKELIEIANAKYAEKFGKEVSFCRVKYDMTDYFVDTETLLDDGISNPVRYKRKKIGTYDLRTNILRIFIDGMPVYENRNGVICKDPVALADSIAEEF
ncbi:hypothetical protein DWV69_00305 [Clostridium sp. AF12-19]|nr:MULTISPECIES: hypothetical protein [unclassified Clostridium]RHS24900.1 hypothetical protein DWV71_06695 [Clostridium sp. AF12-28]RHS30127.1 hypothetical protein DWV69_00305 [Clostridium sp. AF12-19]